MFKKLISFFTNKNIQWLTASRKFVLVTEMTDDHLNNTIRMLETTDDVLFRGAYQNGRLVEIWSRDKWLKHFKKEKANRK